MTVTYLFVFSALLLFLGMTWSEAAVPQIAVNPVQNSIKNDKVNPQKLVEELRKQIKQKEEELQRAEIMNKNVERMMYLVNILGQVDSFLTERAKVIVKKLATLMEVEEESSRGSSKDSDED